ncbi:helix-turn-helix domain-containing protein [Pseudonocardia sp. CA-107938]|uniref:helix-turn-helix domain-containing protein n=1 Tax=Pseudonocardia sp. CA-107938 TaxID=3240021 RepID=UPI003D8EC413
MPSVQDAREALGARLRELRRAAGLTGAELASSLGWPTSKISKLENARQTPSEGDIRAWTERTGRADLTADLTASLHTLEAQYADLQRLMRRGLAANQQRFGDSESSARLLRVFEPGVIPGLLQTADYARSQFVDTESYAQTGSVDIDAAVQVRMQRQEILYRADKRFHLILTEATLRYRPCPPEVMLGQLDRLIALAALPTIKLGIIGFDTVGVSPLHGFWIFDDDQVKVEVYSAELTLAQPTEVAIYRRVFDQLAEAASYGREARLIITRVIDDLLAATGGDDE